MLSHVLSKPMFFAQSLGFASSKPALLFPSCFTCLRY